MPNSRIFESLPLEAFENNRSFQFTSLKFAANFCIELLQLSSAQKFAADLTRPCQIRHLINGAFL